MILLIFLLAAVTVVSACSTEFHDTSSDQNWLPNCIVTAEHTSLRRDASDFADVERILDKGDVLARSSRAIYPGWIKIVGLVEPNSSIGGIKLDGWVKEADCSLPDFAP